MFDISNELSTTQGEWVVKRRNCAATLNNRGSTEITKGYRQFRFVTLFSFARFLQGFG
jgi:hypothetical protein